jgi:pullulanase/glycogen debranching enzyme
MNARKVRESAGSGDLSTRMKKPEHPLHDYVGQISERTEVRVGDPLPMGTHENGAGVNFAFFSRHASRVWLQLFERPADATPFRVIALDPASNRTGDVWHVWVEGIRPGQLYAYRVDGPYLPREGHRYNLHKLLLDPFATAISRAPSWEFGPAMTSTMKPTAKGIATEPMRILAVVTAPGGPRDATHRARGSHTGIVG